MKNPSSLLHRLFSTKKYVEHRCFSKLLAMLPPRMRDFVNYVYRRDETLYFVLKHPGYVMEFNYNKNHINELLKLLQRQYPRCKELRISTIKSYHKYSPPQDPTPPEPLRYSEKARGSFEVATQNEELRQILEKIREAIKKNAQSQK